MSTSIARQWARYALNVRYESLGPAVIAAARTFLKDSIACALGGAQTEDFHILCRVYADLGGKPECTIIGSLLRTNVRNAALANGLAIRALDYNDVYWKQDPCHPSDLLPAALCVAEREHRTGRDLLRGMVVAWELEMRICEAAFPGVRELGWHHASLTQFVSPVVAGLMLGLTEDQIVHAIGINGSHNHTLGAVTAGQLTMMKNTVDPMATEAGVMAPSWPSKATNGLSSSLNNAKASSTRSVKCGRPRRCSQGSATRTRFSIAPSSPSRPKPSPVAIRLHNGRVFTRDRAYPKGDPRDPVSDAETRAKFTALGDGVLPAAQLEQALALIDRVEEIDDIGELMNVLRKP